MRKLFTVAVLSVLLISVAACGESSQSDAGGGGGGGTAPGVSDTEIHVVGLAPLTSPRGSSLEGLDIGAKARFQRENKAGGVHGRKIVLDKMVDDGDDPNVDRDAVRGIIQRDKPFAITPIMTPNFGGASLVEQEGIPTVGYVYDSKGCLKDNVFSFTGCTTPPIEEKVFSPGIGITIRDGIFNGEKGHTAVVTNDDNELGHNSVQACSGPLEAAGFNVVLKNFYLPATSTITDYTSYVQKVMTAANGQPPDLVWHCTAASTTIGLTGALKAAGYPGVQANAVTYDPRVLQSPQAVQALNESYVYLQFAAAESQAPAVKQMVADIKAFDPNASLSLPVMSGYWGADMFIAMLKKTGPDLTREGFLKAANDNFTYAVEGAVCPITFPLAHDEGFVGGGLVQIVDGSYKVTSPLSCESMDKNIHLEK